jgi:splicing suppressor protein 51
MDWYEYYTRLSDKGIVRYNMDRDLRCLSSDPQEREYVDYLRYGTNTTTIQITLVAALETTISSIHTRESINIHIIGSAGPESASKIAFEELLHLFPSLRTLQLTLVGLNVVDLISDTETQNPDMFQCCASCTKMGRKVLIRNWRGPYHAYINSQFYKTPDLAAAFHSGFSVDEQTDWYPTITYLAHAPHPTLFTAAREFEVQGEMRVWKALGAKFGKNAEINKWKGLSPRLTMCGDKSTELNEVYYQNNWWYIVEQGGKGA